MNNLVSVIMPVYNREDVVGESIESLLSQSYKNWELIIIDSGSSDNTLQVCNAYAEKDNRIKIVARKNSGVSASRNAGLKEAQGEYVFFLDSDDVIHPKLLETLVNAMDKTCAKISGSSVLSIRQKNWHKLYEHIEKVKDEAGETEHLSFEKAMEAFFSYTTPINMIGGVMMRKSLIGDTGFCTDLHIGEDYYFVYQNLIKGADAVFLKPQWYYGRLHGTNISNDYSFAGFWSRFHRRELTWQSEEAQGRTKYASRQKLDGFNVYRAYLMRNNYKTPDGKKIRKTMKEYGKVIMPALSWKDKLNFIFSVYFTGAYMAFYRKLKK